MMTEGEIIELFIRAAEVNRRLPDTARPAKLKAQSLHYVHTFAEMNGWDEEEKHAANWSWLDPKTAKVTTKDVGIWEAAMEVMKIIPDPKKRRALWAWATAEAGGQPFAKWCKQVEGISRQLGDWRRKAGIECIALAFARKPLQHNENEAEDDFTNGAEIGDKSVNIENDAPRNWMAEGAKPMACDFDTDLNGFDWADKQNERRRQRQARKAA